MAGSAAFDPAITQPAPTQPAQQQPQAPGDTVPVPGVALEERTITLKHHWNRQELKIVYKIGGTYQPEAMAQINAFMRDRRCDKTIDIDPRLIDLLYDLHQALGAQGAIRIVSAYRSEGYNASLLRAGRNVDPNSQHMLGHAADIIIPGIRGEAIRDMAIKLNRGGVGYYAYSWPNFVHVDTGPVRQWIEADPKAQQAADISPGSHKRVKFDCALTMDEVFKEIPREKVLATLPHGASIEQLPASQNAPFQGTVVPAPSATAAPANQLRTSATLQGTAPLHSVHACAIPESLAPLARLPRHRPVVAAHRHRKKTVHRNTRHARLGKRHRT